jgi:cytochrome c-type biogenesis protein CcmE
VTGTATDPTSSARPATTSVPPGTTATGGPALPAVRRRRSRRYLVVLAILALALVFLLVEGLGSSLNYFDTVDQALAHKATLGTTTFRLEGTVVPGSIHSTKVGSDFTVSQGAQTVAVTNSGSPPQLFQANIPVVVVGHFVSASSTAFVSNQILVKHSATYIAKNPTRVKAPNGTVR